MHLFCKYIALLFISLSLVSCVVGRVSTASYSAIPLGATFIVLEPTKFSLTEKKIQENISEQMKLNGFKKVADKNTADIIVNYSYSIGAGVTKTSVSSSPNLVTGGTNVRSSSSTSYPRYFQITLIDKQSTLSFEKIKIFWQGEVYSSGTSSNISRVSKEFIAEIFNNLGKTIDNKRFIE